MYQNEDAILTHTKTVSQGGSSMGNNTCQFNSKERLDSCRIITKRNYLWKEATDSEVQNRSVRTRAPQIHQ